MKKRERCRVRSGHISLSLLWHTPVQLFYALSCCKHFISFYMLRHISCSLDTHTYTKIFITCLCAETVPANILRNRLSIYIPYKWGHFLLIKYKIPIMAWTRCNNRWCCCQINYIPWNIKHSHFYKFNYI